MTLEFELFSLAEVVQSVPDKLLAPLGNIHGVKVSQSSFVYVVASMNQQRTPKDDRDVIRTTIDVFSFYFDLCPPTVKRVLELCLNDKRVVLFYHSRLATVKFLRLILHKSYKLSINHLNTIF